MLDCAGGNSRARVCSVSLTTLTKDVSQGAGLKSEIQGGTSRHVGDDFLDRLRLADAFVAPFESTQAPLRRRRQRPWIIHQERRLLQRLLNSHAIHRPPQKNHFTSCTTAGSP